MGACFNYRTYPDSLGRAEIIKDWNAAVEESLHESGHSYSGCIGMLHGTVTFKDTGHLTHDAAYDQLVDEHEKWRPALALSYFNKNKLKCWMIGGWCSE